MKAVREGERANTQPSDNFEFENIKREEEGQMPINSGYGPAKHEQIS